MTGKSHLCFGFGAFMGMCAVDYMVNGGCSMSYPELGVALAACEIGSLAPDIDHPNSKISTSDIGLGLVSKGVCAVTSHRQHTHTLLFCILGGIGAYLLSLLTISRANSSTAFLIALATFFILQADDNSQLKKFSSLIAVGVYFGLPFAMAYSPVDIPTVTISISFAKYVGLFFAGGCLSHLFADALCIQGVPVAWPIVPMNKHFRLAGLTTGTLAEAIVSGAASVLFAVGALLLYRVGYFQLPF